MKKIFIAIVSMILVVNILSISVFAKTKDDIKFRDYEWGTSYDEIVSKEVTSSMTKNVDYFLDDTMFILMGQNVAGYDCNTYYVFNDKYELDSGVYILTEEHTNAQQYYIDFKSLVHKLESIYGEDNLDDDKNISWKNPDSIYRNKPGKEGMAIITGDLSSLYEWTDESGNKINIIISGDNYDCQIGLSYYSKDFFSTEDNEVGDTSGL